MSDTPTISDSFVRSEITTDGFRRLTHDEVHTVNHVQELGGILKKVLDDVQNMHVNPDAHVTIDMRWFAIGKTHLEQGLMAIKRSILRPEGM